MKRLLFSLGMLALSGLVMAEVARVGVFVHAPHVYQDEKTREAYGPSVEYIKAVLKEMGYTPSRYTQLLPT